MGKWWCAATVCLGVFASAAVALDNKPPAAPAKPAPAKPAAPAMPPEIAKLPFEIREGYQRFAKRCTTCHDRKRVDTADKSLFDWQGTIGSMAQKKDADIPLEERQSIFLYLAYVREAKAAPPQRDQYMTFLAKCDDCHGVGLVYRDKKPMKDWPDIIHRMAGKGRAQINGDDEKKVYAYIARMYPDLFGAE